MSEEPRDFYELCDRYGGGAVAISLMVFSCIPAGLALFLYTMDPWWLLLCLPLLMFL